MGPDTPRKLEAIKAVWKPGATAASLAKLVSSDAWGMKKPSRNSIIGLFLRWPNELAPCHLTLPPEVKSKMAVAEARAKPEPKQRVQRNTRILNNGYIAPKLKAVKQVPPLRKVIRENYELSEAALRKHAHEERQLERDRANVSSPAYRFEGK